MRASLSPHLGARHLLTFDCGDDFGHVFPVVQRNHVSKAYADRHFSPGPADRRAEGGADGSEQRAEQEAAWDAGAPNGSGGLVGGGMA